MVASTSTRLDVLSEGQNDDSKRMQVQKEKTVSCKICGKKLSSRQSKSRHLNLVHGINAKGTAILKPIKDKVSCVYCDEKYFNTFSLQRHIKTTHLYDANKTKLHHCLTCEYKTPHKQSLLRHNAIGLHKNGTNKSESEMAGIQKRKCLQCDAQFTLDRNLKRHQKKVHGGKNCKLKINRKCPLCSFSSSTFLKTDMYKHFEEVHHLCMKWENHEFSSLDDFRTWKELIEKTTVTSYMRKRLYQNIITLQCNRCGTYKTKGRGFRHMKLKGSCKINSFCPSEIKVKMMGGSIQVKYLAQHVGHENQIEFTRLSLQDRKSIALQLMNKVPKRVILKSIRSTAVNKQLQRIHLTNASDINNIAASLNLQNERRNHHSDVVSTEAWVAEVKESKTTSVNKSLLNDNNKIASNRSVILDKIEGPAPISNYLCKYDYLHKRANNDKEPSTPSEPPLQEVVASTSTQLGVLCEGRKDDDKQIQVKKEKTVSCNICGKQLSSRQSKSRHLNLVHGINAKGTALLKPLKDKVSCVYCDKKYFNTFSLQRHIKTTHLYDANKTKLHHCLTCEYTTPHKQSLLRHNAIGLHKNGTNKSESEMAAIQKRKCLQCDAQFTLDRHLKRHQKNVHGGKNCKLKINRKCPLCSFSSSTFLKTDMYKHFEEVHHLCMKWENHEFSSLDDFQMWKELIEKTTVTSYVRSRLYQNFLILQCNRCGTYKTKGRGSRRMKLKGSCKINSFCPSEIKVKMMGGSIQVKYLAQHVGHENQIEFTRLSLQDRKSIALQLMNKVPKRVILKSIRSTAVNKQLQRIHLTNASDINNIAASLNLRNERRNHHSDVVSTEAWVTELKESKTTSVSKSLLNDNNKIALNR